VTVTRPLIYPSILSADFSRLGEEIRTVDRAGADGIHLDIMDGDFVPNITIGPVVVKWLRPVSALPFWAHLMIRRPLQYGRAFREAGVDGITFHPETVTDAASAAESLAGMGLALGAALSPDTPIDVLDPLLDRLDRILILTVHPGFGGQKLMPEILAKIENLAKKLSGMPDPPLIEVDGGVDAATAEQVIEAGADVLIIGNAIFGESDRAAAIRRFRTIAGRPADGTGGTAGFHADDVVHAGGSTARRTNETRKGS
jgi:ribulose-phosphate 3-epimerase